MNNITLLVVYIQFSLVFINFLNLIEITKLIKKKNYYYKLILLLKE